MALVKEFATDGMGSAPFLSGENDPNRSNETIILLPTTSVLRPGTVLGMVTATNKFKPLDPAASDGSQNFAGLLYHEAPISTADQKNVAVVRHQVVNANLLVYANTMTTNQRKAAEAQATAVGVIGRY